MHVWVYLWVNTWMKIVHLEGRLVHFLSIWRGRCKGLQCKKAIWDETDVEQWSSLFFFFLVGEAKKLEEAGLCCLPLHARHAARHVSNRRSFHHIGNTKVVTRLFFLFHKGYNWNQWSPRLSSQQWLIYEILLNLFSLYKILKHVRRKNSDKILIAMPFPHGQELEEMSLDKKWKHRRPGKHYNLSL